MASSRYCSPGGRETPSTSGNHGHHRDDRAVGQQRLKGHRGGSVRRRNGGRDAHGPARGLVDREPNHVRRRHALEPDRLPDPRRRRIRIPACRRASAQTSRRAFLSFHDRTRRYKTHEGADTRPGWSTAERRCFPLGCAPRSLGSRTETSNSFSPACETLLRRESDTQRSNFRSRRTTSDAER